MTPTMSSHPASSTPAGTAPPTGTVAARRAQTVVAASEEKIARRIAVMLAERRRRSGASVRAVARSSGGRFSAKQLRAIEAGRVAIDPETAHELAELYGIDVTIAAPDRMPIEIDPRGVLSTGGSAISFDPRNVDSLLENYLRLVRALRGEERPQAIELRRNDVEVLSQYLELPGEAIVERLAALMGATQLQRRVLAGMFVAGAMVIGLLALAAANLQAAEEAEDADDAFDGRTEFPPAVVVDDLDPSIGTI